MPETNRSAAFIDEMINFPSLRKIRLCMQCGTCTGSCPVAQHMEHTPAQLIAMVRADLREEVLGSPALWQCVSCYKCSERCPRGIKVADIIYALKRLSLRSGQASRRTPTPELYRQFVNNVYRHGRVSEFGLMAAYYLKTRPFKAWRALPLAWRLWVHGRSGSGRSGLSPQGRRQVQVLLDRARSLKRT